VTVDVYDLLLNAAGRYDLRAVFDFTDAIPDTEVGRVIDLIVELFNDPAAFVFDLVEYVVDAYLGQVVGGIVEWALNLFRDQLEAWMREWLEENAPAWLDQILVIGQDLTQVIASLELLAELRISKLTSDWYVQGEEEWLGVVLHWRTGCAPEGDPAFDPDCGRIELTLDQLRDTEFPIDLVAGVWNGTITHFDTLTIERHAIQLEYGRLILYVLNEILLPAVSGGEYHSLLDAAQGLVDCESLAAAISDDVLAALGTDRAEVAGWCEDGIALFLLPLVSTIEELGMDSHLRLQGTALLVDEDDDLIVDRIQDGAWDGQVEWDPGSGWGAGDFTGTWEATRK